MELDKRKIILIALGAVALILIIVILIWGKGPVTPTFRGNLTIWGLYDSRQIWNKMSETAKSQKPFASVSLKYEQKANLDYENDLTRALKAGSGPDVFLINSIWLPRYEDVIYSVSSTKVAILNLDLNPISFSNDFADVASNDLIKNGSILGVPLYLDTLALYYNKDLFAQYNIVSPPKTWKKLVDETVPALTLKSEDDTNVTQAGIAMGTSNNVNRATDILSALMLQNGTQMTNDNKDKVTFNKSMMLNGKQFFPGENALEFYTSFATPGSGVYTWGESNNFHYSIDAFAEGTAGMMINYYHQKSLVEEKNSNLNFGIASLPQISETDTPVNYANYWVAVVNKNSKNKATAMAFLAWLSSEQAQRKYQEETGRPPVYKKLIEEKLNDPELSVFAKQALSAENWYQVDNWAVEQAFSDMIKSVVEKQATLMQALSKASDTINLIMDKVNR